MNIGISVRLSIMMFLQFFLWGAWYVTAYNFLGTIGFQGGEIGWTYSVGPIAGMISPFFVGMIADRFFPTERVLGAMHLIGGLAMFGAIGMMGGVTPLPFVIGEMSINLPVIQFTETPSALMINLLFFAHMFCYYPTLALTNTLAMHNMTNAEKEFPRIRVFGTIGWILAGWLVSWQGWDAAVNLFYLAGGTSIVMGLYSFTLPHTPPPSAGSKTSFNEIVGADAWALLKKPSFFMFMLSSFLICIPLAFYYAMAGKFVGLSGFANPAGIMTMGQMSEVFFMLVMPLFFVRLGVKWMLLVGMAAWVLRYLLFALGAPDDVAWMIIVGIVLHGICYDFFFVTGQIYTDKVAPKQIRGQAQGLLVFFTLGWGMFIGSQTAGFVEGLYTPENAKSLMEQAGAKDQEIATLKADEATDHSVQIAELEKESFALKKQASPDWVWVWGIPAVFAGVVMLIFGAMFREDPEDAKKEVAVGH